MALAAGGRERTAPPLSPATRQLLAWLAAAPRTYAEVVEVWRTSCPRLSVWEDAIADGLVAVSRVDGLVTVVPSARGCVALDGTPAA